MFWESWLRREVPQRAILAAYPQSDVIVHKDGARGRSGVLKPPFFYWRANRNLSVFHRLRDATGRLSDQRSCEKRNNQIKRVH